MLGLFGTLNLGTRSLTAAQTGVEVAGQNLANVNNPAYSRQRVNFSTSMPTPTFVGPQGTGVQVVSIEQLRNALIDAQVRGESSVGGFWNAQQNALQNAQTQLGEFLNQSAASVNNASGTTAISQGLSAQLNGLFNAFQDVATNPTSSAQRLALINQAQSLTTGFNQAARNLTAVHDGLNTSLNNDATSANQLLSDVADLNKQIVYAEASGTGKANDLRDLREQKMENLAQLTDFSSSEAADGSINISIGATQLVAGQQVLDTLQTYDAGGGQFLIRTATGGTPLTLTGGSLAGTINARDGALQDLQTNLDTLASALISQVNNLYSAGYDLNGNTGANFFTGTDSATIGVNATLLADPSAASLIQAAGVPGATGDNAVALALGRLQGQAIGALGNQTFSDNYAANVASFGNALANANEQVTSYNAVNTMLLNQRNSVSGVSIEEEMANLITFQTSYQASSKIISTVDQMLQTVVNLKR